MHACESFETNGGSCYFFLSEDYTDPALSNQREDGLSNTLEYVAAKETIAESESPDDVLEETPDKQGLPNEGPAEVFDLEGGEQSEDNYTAVTTASRNAGTL